MGTALGRSAFAGPVIEVAPRLLGAVLHHDGVSLRITEVEAYGGAEDPGSHAYRGPTPRTRPMFGPAGHLYVYLSYGIHRCVNVVTGVPGEGAAVLLRAGEVCRGQERAERRRLRPGARPPSPVQLARGPGNLARALGLGAAHDGADLCGTQARVWVEAPPEEVSGAVRSGPRVGVSGSGGSGERYPWRFWLAGEPTVSAYRAGTRKVDRAEQHPPARKDQNR